MSSHIIFILCLVGAFYYIRFTTELGLHIQFNRLSIIEKANLFDKIKRDFFQAVSPTTIWMHRVDPNKILIEKTRWELQKITMNDFDQILESYPKTQQMYDHLPPISKITK